MHELRNLGFDLAAYRCILVDGADPLTHGGRRQTGLADLGRGEGRVEVKGAQALEEALGHVVLLVKSHLLDEVLVDHHGTNVFPAERERAFDERSNDENRKRMKIDRESVLLTTAVARGTAWRRPP